MKTPPHKNDRDTRATTERHPFLSYGNGMWVSQFSLSINKTEAPETMCEDEATKLLTDMLTVA